MTANITYQLLLVLVLVAGLGIVIGAALLHLKAIHDKRKLAQHHRLATEKLRDHLADLEHRHAALQRAGSAENQLLSIAKNKESQASAQQEALEGHSRLQSQRIASLEASLLAAEERGLRVQRDFESYKTHKEQELLVARRLVSEERIAEDHVAERPIAEQTDSDLPVLNKRVGNEVVPASAVQAMEKLFDHEIDIPSLSESELPGSINDINFAEFAEFDELDLANIEIDERKLEELLEDEADPVG